MGGCFSRGRIFNVWLILSFVRSLCHIPEDIMDIVNDTLIGKTVSMFYKFFFPQAHCQTPKFSEKEFRRAGEIIFGHVIRVEALMTMSRFIVLHLVFVANECVSLHDYHTIN